jgi:hypothetical protein
MQPNAVNPLELKREILDHDGWFIHVSRGSAREAILAEGLVPAHFELTSHITGQHVLC